MPIDERRDAARRKLVEPSGRGDNLYDPATGKHVPVRDVTQEFREASQAWRPSSEETKRFLQHRAMLVKNPSLLPPSARTLTQAPPPPGGVGSGIVFKDGDLLFADHTAAYYYIVAPAVLGGNTAPYLYLTSSNRASKGCEALVSYQGQDLAEFRVWDWATPPAADGGHWTVIRSYGQWDDYKIPFMIGGQDVETLYVINVTRRLAGSRWANEVYLHNRRLGTRDRVWRFEFDWQPAAEAEKYFFWGPIIETFFPDYGDTNPVGFSQILLVQDGQDQPLTTDNSDFRIDDGGHGFQVYYPPSFNYYFSDFLAR